MIVSELVENSWLCYRGKGASKTPTVGTEKYNIVLSIANRKTQEWAKDPKQTWASNFAPQSPHEPGTVSTSGVDVTGVGTYFTDYRVGDTLTIGGETRTIDAITSDTALTVSVAYSTFSGVRFTRHTIIATGVTEYSLHRLFYTPSDSAIVTITTQDVYYNYTPPQQREVGGVYIYGRSPKQLVFYTEPSTQVVGGELKVAGYYLPDALSAATDLVAVDDANWLVYAVAAELARNDPAKDAEFGNLIGMANDLYGKMVAANQYLGFNQANTISYDMPLIGGSEEW